MGIKLYSRVWTLLLWQFPQPFPPTTLCLVLSPFFLLSPDVSTSLSSWSLKPYLQESAVHYMAAAKQIFPSILALQGKGYKSFTTSVKCTFSPSLALHYQLLASMAVCGGYSDATPWRLNISSLEKESGQSGRYSLLFQVFISTRHLPPHLHFCLDKVFVWNSGLPHFPPPQHSSFSLVKGQGVSLTGIWAIWLRAAIILGIFCQSINITALGRP